MHNHWDKNLNVKDLVKKYKPHLIVELGAGGGDNTIQYLELQKTQPFELIVISDGALPKHMKNMRGFVWVFGLSFLELPQMADASIDFCSIDTDHNYWTLNQELTILEQKMKPGGIVVMHDTESYKTSSGLMMGYTCGYPYPPEIHEQKEKGMVDALNEALARKAYKLIKHCPDSAGATAIQKI